MSTDEQFEEARAAFLEEWDKSYGYNSATAVARRRKRINHAKTIHKKKLRKKASKDRRRSRRKR